MHDRTRAREEWFMGGGMVIGALVAFVSPIAALVMGIGALVVSIWHLWQAISSDTEGGESA